MLSEPVFSIFSYELLVFVLRLTTTERVILGLKAYEAGMLGRLEVKSHERWDRHAAQMVLKAAEENPGKRILQLTGIENCPLIRDELHRSNRITLVEMEEWLRKHMN